MQANAGDRLDKIEATLQRATERQEKAELQWKQRMDRAEQRMDRHEKRMAAADRKWEQRWARNEERWARNEERWARNEERWARLDERMAITDKQIQATRRLLEGGIKFVQRLSAEVREVSKLQKAMLRSRNGHNGHKH